MYINLLPKKYLKRVTIYSTLFHRANKRNKKVTLSIDSSTYEVFKEYFEEYEIMLSKNV